MASRRGFQVFAFGEPRNDEAWQGSAARVNPPRGSALCAGAHETARRALILNAERLPGLRSATLGFHMGLPSAGARGAWPAAAAGQSMVPKSGHHFSE
jgi:hypothetical protein